MIALSDTQKKFVQSALLFIAGVAVGAFVMGTWPTPAESPELAEEPDTVQQAVQTQPGSEEHALLAVPNQAAGFDVAVRHVIVEQPSWVVIYEDAGGQPGNALGAGRFTETRMSGTVHLLRGTLPQNTYYAVIHLDDGDRIFSLERDFPVRDELGNPIMVTFVTQ